MNRKIYHVIILFLPSAGCLQTKMKKLKIKKKNEKEINKRVQEIQPNKQLYDI